MLACGKIYPCTIYMKADKGKLFQQRAFYFQQLSETSLFLSLDKAVKGTETSTPLMHVLSTDKVCKGR